MEKRKTDELKQLGNSKTEYTFEGPDKKILETFKNLHPNIDYVINFKAPEFTSLCPKTGQPDFATIYIQYIPNSFCIESKSLKLYLFSYRNFGEFHEDCVCRIMKDIRNKIHPRWIRVEGQFRPRGGISIVPIVEWSEPGYKDKEVKKIGHEFTV